jgi:site-specific DNA recombinase
MPRSDPPRKRCAIYTRKSSEEGLEQEFNSLHAQREACEAYIRSQRHEGWVLMPTAYDDGGFSGGTMERPACSDCSPISGRIASMSSSPTRSTG